MYVHEYVTVCVCGLSRWRLLLLLLQPRRLPVAPMSAWRESFQAFYRSSAAHVMMDASPPLGSYIQTQYRSISV